MTDSDIEILFSSDPNYDKVTCELFYKGKFIALLNQDAGLNDIIIEFPGGNLEESEVTRRINLDIFEKALSLAKLKISE